jgi:hypothetical protein
MNPNDMSAQEAADWCAKDDGWTRIVGVPGMLKEDDDLYLKWKLRHHEQWDHCHPLTLDGAAAALPEGVSVCIKSTRAGEWSATGRKHGQRHCAVAPDELTARFRLAVVCRMAMRSGAGALKNGTGGADGTEVCG